MLQLPLTHATDSYKVSHWKQFPENTQYLFYYVESRSTGEFIVPFGLQYIIKRHFLTVPSEKEVYDAKKFWDEHGFPNVFNLNGWLKISKLGYLPLEIRAVPEGQVIPTKNVFVTVVNTDPEFYWLPGWIETLLMQIWYPTTVCTRSWVIKQIIQEFLKETSDTMDSLPFKLHDFGFRGATCLESACIGGMAHLVNFAGTDTVVAIPTINTYYGPNRMWAFSIPAAEHSTITSWGKEHEVDAFRNMLIKFPENNVIAVVSDSYDIDNAVCNLWGNKLKEEVVKSGKVIVVRPDSGTPEEIVVRTLLNLERYYPIEFNSKGYKELKHVSVIQGDSISDPEVIRRVLQAVKDVGFSTNNVTFGMGGGLLQKLDRDTYKFAMKCSARFDGKSWVPVFKQPKEDPWKTSKKGRLTLIKSSPHGYCTIDIDKVKFNKNEEVMRTVFRNGELLVDDTFDTIRKRTGWEGV